FLFYQLGRSDEADAHLDRAYQLFADLADAGSLAQVDETRARVLLSEARYPEAVRLLTSVIKTFEQSGQQALLVEALTTYGSALARLGQFKQACVSLERAALIGEQYGDLE